MKNPVKKYTRQSESGISSAFFIVLVLCLTALMMLLSSCTDYERAGINPRPFNEPASWEINPYGDAFHN